MPFIILSFVAGVLTILAPCILPLLPVIVGRSITDSTLSKRRVVIVVLSLGLSVILFTLILKVSSIFVNIPQDFWRYISAGIIFIFGLVTIFPNLWENISVLSGISQKSNKVLMEGYKKNNIWGDVIVGASLGPIFSACSPTYFVILATVLPVSFALGLLYLFVYTFGLCLALLIVSLLGQKIMSKLNFAMDANGWFKKTLGVIFILVSIAIFTGYDKTLQISLLNGGFFDVTKVEQTLLNNNTPNTPSTNNAVQNKLQNNDSSSSAQPSDVPAAKNNFLTLTQKAAKFPVAPEITQPSGFINTDGQPVTLAQFKGKKVVLIDFWTYSCINCQRTIPYLNDWYKKYADQGLEIIGVSTPEFAFEKVQSNVEEAVKNLGIRYPVVLDNNMETWNAYGNQYWPREYLVDIDGYIVHDHAGEGDYDVTEKAIQQALTERDSRLGITPTAMPTVTASPTGKISFDSNKVGSPETYFGAGRNEYLANGSKATLGNQALTIPNSIDSNQLYLGGDWNFVSENAENSGDGTIVYKYDAKNVYMVASSTEGTDVDVYLDGKFDHTVYIKDETLYPIIQGASYGEHTLKLVIKKPGIKAFTFTFG